jgi:hypothetical protein
MTITTGIEWRRQSPTLWTGRCSGYPVGTIELGRGFAAIDADGRLHGRYRTLQEAEAALTEPAPVVEEQGARRRPAAPLVLATTCGGVFATGAAAVALLVLH